MNALEKYAAKKTLVSALKAVVPELVGGTAGGAIGAASDKENRIRGALLGIAGGAVLGRGAYKVGKSYKDLKKTKKVWKNRVAKAEADLKKAKGDLATAKKEAPAKLRKIKKQQADLKGPVRRFREDGPKSKLTLPKAVRTKTSSAWIKIASQSHRWG